MSAVKAKLLNLGDTVVVHGEEVVLYDLLRMGGTTALRYLRPGGEPGEWLVSWEQVVDRVAAADGGLTDQPPQSMPDNTLSPTGNTVQRVRMPSMPPIPMTQDA